MTSLQHFNINPILQKGIIIFLCILVTVFGITAKPKTSEAIFPFLIPIAAMTASEIITVGTLAVASGLILSYPDQTAAIIQDMWRKGHDLLSPFVGQSEITIDQATADFIQAYTLDDATTLQGQTLQYGGSTSTATSAPWEGTDSYLSIVAGKETITKIEYKNTSGAFVAETSISNYRAFNDLAPNLAPDTTEMSLQRYNTYQYATTPVSITIYGYQVKGYGKNITAGFNFAPKIAFKDSSTLAYTIIDIPVSDSTASEGGKWYVEKYHELATPITVTAERGVAWFATTDGNNTFHWEEIEVFTKAMTATEVAETVITGDSYGIDFEWAIPNNLAGTKVGTIPVTGTTTADAITAVTTTTTAELTLTDVATGQPYTPKLPPSGNPQLPWWAFFAYFIDMLRAMIQYTVRLAEFIVTLQGIQERGVGEYSEIYSWFRNLKLAGLNVYSIVISLATFSVSLMIYRVVKRV